MQYFIDNRVGIINGILVVALIATFGAITLKAEPKLEISQQHSLTSIPVYPGFSTTTTGKNVECDDYGDQFGNGC